MLAPWKKSYDQPSSVQLSSVTQSCLPLRNPMVCSIPGLPVHHQLLEFTQTHVKVGDAIQPSHPLWSLLLQPSIFPSIRVFSNESVLHIRWPKYWSFSFSISPSNEYSGLISFKMDWLDLPAVQGTLKSLLQHHRSKASILTSLNTLLMALKKQDLESLPTPLLLLWEVAGTEGIVRVHVLFSFSDLSQTEKHLGSFSSDPDTYLKEFKNLTSLMTRSGMIFTFYSTLPSSQKRKNESGKLLRLMPMKYIKLMTLSL